MAATMATTVVTRPWLACIHCATPSATGENAARDSLMAGSKPAPSAVVTTLTPSLAFFICCWVVLPMLSNSACRLPMVLAVSSAMAKAATSPSTLFTIWAAGPMDSSPNSIFMAGANWSGASFCSRFMTSTMAFSGAFCICLASFSGSSLSMSKTLSWLLLAAKPTVMAFMKFLLAVAAISSVAPPESMVAASAEDCVCVSPMADR